MLDQKRLKGVLIPDLFRLDLWGSSTRFEETATREANTRLFIRSSWPASWLFFARDFERPYFSYRLQSEPARPLISEKMSGIFYGKEQFDAQLIISQMVCMQALHYLGMGVSFVLMDTLLGVPMSLDQFFSDRIFADGIMPIWNVKSLFLFCWFNLCVLMLHGRLHWYEVQMHVQRPPDRTIPFKEKRPTNTCQETRHACKSCQETYYCSNVERPTNVVCIRIILVQTKHAYLS